MNSSVIFSNSRSLSLLISMNNEYMLFIWLLTDHHCLTRFRHHQFHSLHHCFFIHAREHRLEHSTIQHHGPFDRFSFLYAAGFDFFGSFKTLLWLTKRCCSFAFLFSFQLVCWFLPPSDLLYVTLIVFPSDVFTYTVISFWTVRW